MKRMNTLFRVACLLGTCSLTLPACAQFYLDGEFRPRTELRHGFGGPIPEDSDAGYAISTRLRLNAGYEMEAYSFYLSLQDVLVWGENRQLLPADQNNSFSIFQAWAKIRLGERIAAKLGRQVISYDDQRIFGGLDWAQQGRNHDAALIQYAKGSFMADLALAFSQDITNPTGFESEGTAYTTTGFFSYKTMQYLYAKKQWENFRASLLLLNNGFQDFDVDGNADGVNSLQTFGTHLEFDAGGFLLAGNAFVQTGEMPGGLDVSGAYLLGLDVNYQWTGGPNLGAGAEYISGNDGENPDETGAFFPLYGTNHKFNGFMDYFYVGNHANSVGLFDVHASANFKFGSTSGLLVKALHFSAAEDLPSGSRGLGTEVDLVYSQAFNGFSIQVGYSHMFPSDGMYELKGVAEADAAGSQYWAWAMLVLKPKLIWPKT